ncbi:MAG: UDP-N-acetylmuramoyl-L-alanyl-D-glutamate--2,6-diaminopimelate ligase [Candidatus Nomurabacteria bacterium]|jgi:UDP-N-acetylmuramoyl-L-alanyl-D-glutamate--2,6-diaminopimelate ligase|nr:UDP-N-acetylmuramoyl-L-alanyl-D-glutamate--2,6-diaminopimelate ligase [Candidatus Nomurabacteria bacterium]
MTIKHLIEKVPAYDTLILPYHRVQAWRAANNADYPASAMKVIGVTGTNGKTTTCFMIYQMLKSAGKKVGLMTTVGWGVDKVHSQITHMTTATPKLLNKRIREIADSGAEYLVLELTSHALAQHRAFGVPIDVAVMTNVTHEHLDYHKTFSRYCTAKEKLFRQAQKTHNGRKIGIINADDPTAVCFARDIENVVSYGVNDGDLRARQVKLTPNGVEYYVKVPSGDKLHIKTKIAGEFNVYNSLAAVAVGLAYGLTGEQIEQGIFALESVEGRMNTIDEGQNFHVIVDYAHTPDSFEKLFNDMKSSAKGRIIALFGSAGGRRDPSKRRPQGEIAGKNADIVILTEEDDRDTSGQEILNQIAAGVEAEGKIRDKDLFLIHDRPKAIKFALEMAKKDDVVLLLGKGHEKTIERKDGEHAWDEIGTARKILREIIKKS